ncbi:aldo/keto reductase [Desulfoscipio gibsoniae]|uniref:Putative oxidoreductase, aryl-alcohol dehydrogenase like protein n=1 Tax=Desulfoscipio gibsoniae DSM 7213 TaxID=767817 RepID=R4KKH6_9FIRM|nr:aldo/keto reductase [Desulfoscipio gibsoniae]AGL02082.1 putative oxidoreductase, aryl-alcohol dehydrogenase like protein [Desulfoscipio gibsoniae DSM 7213]
MQYKKLGNTEITVSRLCFGTLTIGPLQRGLDVEAGAGLIRQALELGVNFMDTAEIYGCYPYIKEAIRGFPDAVVASKSYAPTGPEMQKSLYKCLKELGRDYVDIFLLHEQESLFTIKGHWEAVEYLVKAREKGLVRAIGISTHYVAGVRAAASIPEFDIIHPLINRSGIGIADGGARDMLDAIAFAAMMGKGIYGMKCLGGGHLIPEMDSAMDFILAVPGLTAVAVGMQSPEEIKYNVSKFSGIMPDQKLVEQLKGKKRRLHVEDYCRGCGQCVERCTAGALAIVDGRARVNMELCRLCGYCASVCPDFCIKVI